MTNYTELYNVHESKWQELTNKRFLCPYDEIPKGSRVILYGAGTIGKKVYDSIIDNSGWEIIAWIDKNNEYNDKRIASPEILSSENELDYDFIYIAVKRANIVREIIKELIELGVLKDKIVSYNLSTNASDIDDCFKKEYDSTKQIKYWSDTHEKLAFIRPLSCTSMICNQSFFDAPFAQYWSSLVHNNFVDLMKASEQLSEKCYNEGVTYHRKLWEFIYICQALYENGMLCEGKRGVAFGVGTECLPDLFASFGCHILATDWWGGETVSHWMRSEENAGGNLLKLNKYGFCDEKVFLERVDLMDVNMNEIPESIEGYDFCWSACALEHIGGIEAGLDFIKNSLNTLKPGGIAIHTTEFNLYSNDRTYENPGLSIFRRRDIEGLIKELEEQGHYVYPMDWNVGESVVDEFVDIPPYSKKDMHLRLKIQEFPSTSIGIIIKKSVL